MAELRRRLGEDAPLPPPPPVPRIPAPPAHVFPRPARRGSGATAEREAAAQHTTALIGIGHVGTRYATDVVLQFRAELAVSREAVAAELPEDWAAQNGLLPLCSRVTHHREFLLRPDLGRRLDEPSLARLRAEATKGVDVQIIVADGLSAVACMKGGAELLAALTRECTALGFSVGTPVCARFARVWLEDEIGQEVGAKVSAILLGERPGLGTGDGLSAYLVHAPRIGKTDGDRNMMSNIHARGTHADHAAQKLARLAAAMIEQGTSGVGLNLSNPELAEARVAYRAPQVRERLVSTP
jgi:ethanolamine ammonia-lyase small subunit